MTPGDSYWLDAKHFLKTHLQPAQTVIVPAKYRHDLPHACSYDASFDRPVDQFEWVLIHKGLTYQISGSFLRQAIATLHPVFANEVFVLFAKHPVGSSDFDQFRSHLLPLLQKLDPERAAQLGGQKPGGWVNRIRRSLKRTAVTPDQIDQVSRRIDRLQGQINRLDRRLNQPEKQPVFAYSAARLAKLTMAQLQTACRSASQTVYLGNETVLCRVLTSHLLYGDTQDIGIVPHLCLNGYWEGWVTLAMARLLQPGWYCVDVGANAGYYSLLMAGAVGQAGRVAAIEPNPRLVNLLRKTLEVNGFESWATVLPAAVSSSSGVAVQLSVPPGHPGNGTIVGSITASDAVYQTETITIDQLTQDWQRVDLIKIDAEGAEEQIWQGMRETIRRHPNLHIVLEFGAVRYADPEAFLTEIQAAGFVVRHANDNGELQEVTIDRCLTEHLDRHWDLFLSRN